MQQDTWLRAHVAMFEAFTGSVPRIVPDNLKTGVIEHPREGEVVLNDAYREMAAHYSAAVLPGRVRHPKDKASVENTVAHVATWVIAGSATAAVHQPGGVAGPDSERMEAYNRSRSRSGQGSRASVFTAEEKPLLHRCRRRLRDQQVDIWAPGRPERARGLGEELLLGPYTHIGRTVDLRVTDTMLRGLRGTERLTSHLLLPEGAANEYRTNDADLPAAPSTGNGTRARVEEWAGRIGPAAVTVVNRIFESVPVDEQGQDAALAVLRLLPAVLGRTGRGGLPACVGRPGAVPAVCASAADPGQRAGQSRRPQAPTG